MTDYKFSILIDVRYSDLDPQWHVNHTRFITYMEQARLEYLQHLGLFNGNVFLDYGLIIADVHVSFFAPIVLGQKVRVGTRTEKIGTKSIAFDYILEDEASNQIFAKGEVVNVGYDYRVQETVPIPNDWRIKIGEFECKTF